MSIRDKSTKLCKRLMRAAAGMLFCGLVVCAGVCWAAPPSHFQAQRGGFRAPQSRAGAAGGMRREARPQARENAPTVRQGGRPSNPYMRPGAGPGGMRPGSGPGQQHLPEWWQSHRGLSPRQQADALRREPGFRNLPQQQQQRLIDRLHNFDQRPAIEQQRMMDRNEMFERLPAERQQAVRGAAQALGRMSPDRQAVIRHAFQQLREMPPDERQRVLSSAYGSQFSPQERTVLGNLLSIEPYQGRIVQPYFGR